MKQPKFDKDGNPTEETLDYIRKWKIESKADASELMNFCFEAWRGTQAASWYWEGFVSGYTVCELHTGGWSGNEDIIQAMQDNHLFWSLCWQESRRGGHYKFNLEGVPE